MKNSMKVLSMGIGKLGYQVTKANVNSACCSFLYQEKLPKKADKLRKF